MPAPPRFAVALAVLWTVGAVVALGMPGALLAVLDLPALSLPALDKGVHVVLFAGFAWLWLRAYPRAAVLVLGAGLAFSVGSELYQGLPSVGRGPSPYDLAANAAGLALGYGWARWRQRPAGLGDETVRAG